MAAEKSSPSPGLGPVLTPASDNKEGAVTIALYCIEQLSNIITTLYFITYQIRLTALQN